MLLGTANVMEGVVNWTILIVNRGAAHGSLQAAQPAIRRIVACSPQHHSELAVFPAHGASNAIRSTETA